MTTKSKIKTCVECHKFPDVVFRKPKDGKDGYARLSCGCWSTSVWRKDNSALKKAIKNWNERNKQSSKSFSLEEIESLNSKKITEVQEAVDRAKEAFAYTNPLLPVESKIIAASDLETLINAVVEK